MRAITQVFSAASACMAVFAWLALAGCDETGPRIYTARPYLPEADCLDFYTPVAQVEAGDLPPTCDPVCFHLAEQLYVSAVCSPLPSNAVLVAPEEDGNCAAALLRFDEGLTCEDSDSEAPDAGDAGLP
jgi:hypothetical protein